MHVFILTSFMHMVLYRYKGEKVFSHGENNEDIKTNLHTKVIKKSTMNYKVTYKTTNLALLSHLSKYLNLLLSFQNLSGRINTGIKYLLY